MSYLIYDFVDVHGRNVIHEWHQTLQKFDRAKFDKKVDALAEHGFSLSTTLLAGTDVAGISKLRIHGNVQLRPLLCKGPVNPHMEFTLLAGATERDDELDPAGVLDVADSRRNQVTADPTNRRVEHDY